METKMSTVEFAEKYFGMKFFDYQKRILNSLDKNRDENILVWMPSRDIRKSLYSYYLMEKWLENRLENRLENKLESDKYAESGKE